MRLFLALLLLAGCAPSLPTGPDRPYVPGALPAFPVLVTDRPAGHTSYDNGTLADLLVTLTHELEWGAKRPHLIRYEGPVSVGVIGDGARPFTAFLDRLLGRIRANTSIEIARAPKPNNLVINFVSGQDFRTSIPQHYCVVAPGLIDWDQFRQSPIRYGTEAYEAQTAMTGMTIFIPDNAAPHIVRTCLIEEVLQALGPANDLYGLGPSIFNDDAAHVWPTALDYLMLRVLYSPLLRSGMDRGETRAAAGVVLGELNPEGSSSVASPLSTGREQAGWALAIRKAFDPRRSRDDRIAQAERALAIAERARPDTAFHCRAAGALARVGRKDARRILAKVADADRVCARAHGTRDIRVARIRLEMARLYYDLDQPGRALELTDDLAPWLAEHGQDERLTALYALRAAALRAIQRTVESREARRLAGEWGAYALGRDHPNVRRWRQQ